MPVRTLLADDAKLSRTLVRRSLQAVLDAPTFEEAEDGQVAIAALTARPFDLVSLDLHMPHAGGLEVLAALRAMPGGRETPVLLVTADGLGPEGEALAGADPRVAVVQKPFTAETLRAAARRVLPPGLLAP